MKINDVEIDTNQYIKSDIYWIQKHKNGTTILFDKTHKQCTKCKKMKYFEEFYINKNLFLNAFPKCKKCLNDHVKQKLFIEKQKLIDQSIKINNYIVDVSDLKIDHGYWIRTYKGEKTLFNETHKRCSVCDEIKLFDDFYSHKNSFLNLNKKCKNCAGNQNKKNYRNDSKTKNEYQKIYNQENTTYNIEKLPLGYKTRNKNNFLQVSCYKCKKWTFLTNSQLNSILRSQHEIKGGSSNIYCSDECKNECFSYRNSNIKQIRAFNMDLSLTEYEYKLYKTVDYTSIEIAKNKAKERDNYTCQKCESTKDLRGHHIIPVALCIGTENEYLIYETANIKTVCLECHKKEHIGELSTGKLSVVSKPNFNCL